MQRNPIIGESAADEIPFPCFIRAEAAFGRASERGMRSGSGRSVGHEIVDCRNSIRAGPCHCIRTRTAVSALSTPHLFLIDRSILHQLMNSRRQIVRLLDVTFVEFEMHG